MYFKRSLNRTLKNKIFFLKSQQRRNLFIQMEETPNPNSMKFIPLDKPLTNLKNFTLNIPSPSEVYRSPLARHLFKIDYIKSIFITNEFVTVTKSEEVEWGPMKMLVYEALMNFINSNKPIFNEDALPAEDTQPVAEDDEVVISIKELLDTKIRPMVQEDGGDVQYHSFKNGVCYLRMQGSCSSCPTSSVTLKGGIENMLKHYIPEVEEVKEYTESQESEEMLAKVENATESHDVHPPDKNDAAKNKAFDAINDVANSIPNVSDPEW